MSAAPSTPINQVCLVVPLTGPLIATELQRRTARAPAGLATALLQEPENDRRHP